MSEDIIKALITSTANGTILCGHCKKGMHSIAGIKEGQEETTLLKDRCNNEACECICKTHYIARDGSVQEFETIDCTDPLYDFGGQLNPRNKDDDIIDQLNHKFHKARRQRYASTQNREP